MFEDIRHERWLKILLSLTVPDSIKQSKTNDHEIKEKKSCFRRKITATRIIKKIALVHHEQISIFCFSTNVLSIFELRSRIVKIKTKHDETK